MSAIRPAAAKWRVISAATAPSASPKPCCSAPCRRLMLKTGNNPEGLPIEVFDGLRASTIANRSQFFLDLSMPFYGYNRPGAKISEGVRYSFWLQGMMCGAQERTTTTSRRFPKPTSLKTSRRSCADPGRARRRRPDRADRRGGIKDSETGEGRDAENLPGAPHGMATTLADQFNADLLAFIKG